jgi:signal transduction histidine kinase
MSRITGWVAYALAWALATVVYALMLVAQGYTTPAEALISSAVFMGTGALGGVAVWFISARFALPARARWRFFSAHLAIATVYAAVCVGVQYVWLLLAAGAAVSAWVMRMAGIWMFLQSVLIYGVVAGISYAVRVRQRLRAQQFAAERAEAAATRAQLAALRAQLNPHFLFNSLHSLGALVRHDPDAAEEAIEELGALLRYTLDRGDCDLVHLEDEWNFARTYLQLEQRRLGPRLRVNAEISEQALECAVPPFLLQPLVENAVKHGIAPRHGGGTLTVRALVRGEQLEIEVRDDGEGTSPARLESGGVGLRSVREQLRARYNGRSAFAVHTSPGNGFSVQVVLPAEQDTAIAATP